MADKEQKYGKCEECGRPYWHKRHGHHAAAGCGGFYFFGFFGALVYFVNAASGFWPVVVAFFQAIVWPAYIVYYALHALIK